PARRSRGHSLRRTWRSCGRSKRGTPCSPRSTSPGGRGEALTTLSFHFHGYQPGDIVRWLAPDPLKPPRFEERHSPVAMSIGSERVRGKNWTDAVLRTYGRLEAVLERTSGVASVDIEPQTLVWLLERDPDAYHRAVAAWRRGA